MIPGRIALLLDREALAAAAAGRSVVLVTGTNGKTTTSHLAAAALAAAGVVAHNASGANMADGVLTALLAQPRARFAVLEVDELHLGEVAAATDPAVVVLLNFTRDQLDRLAEVRSTAATAARSLRAHPDCLVVANADDPLVVWAAAGLPHVVWVAGGATWRSDAESCPRCGEWIEFCGPTDWVCRSCRLARPRPDWWYTSCSGQPRVVRRRRGQVMATHALRLALPGTFNRANAVAALAAVTSLGVPTGIAAARLAEVDQVAGRYAWATLAGREVRLLLVKNPAGWSEICGMMEGRRNPLVMVINAQEADGIDVSWLWDLRLDGLCGRSVAVAGERAADLGVRLSYAGVGHSTELDPLEAIRHMPPGLVEVVATYSAFSDLVRRLRPRPTRSVTEHDRPPEATEPTTTAL